MSEDTADTRPAPTAEGASTRRWAQELGELQNRIRKLKTGVLPPAAVDLLEDALSLSVTLLQELAGAQLLQRRMQADMRRSTASWGYLFDRVPVPCVVTDSAGTIISANRAASLFLNISAKHLVGRLLLHFSDDREKFGTALLAVATDRTRIEQVMTIRPKERAPREMLVVIVPESPEQSGRHLWFLQPMTPTTRSPVVLPATSEQATAN